LVIVSLLAKFLTVYLASRFQGLSKLTSLRAGIGLSSSGGELALVVAKGGNDVGVTSSFLLPMVGAMTINTTFISPYVIKFGWMTNLERIYDLTLLDQILMEKGLPTIEAADTTLAGSNDTTAAAPLPDVVS
jgi:Kef-type K+ transport system membrane component KefB